LNVIAMGWSKLRAGKNPNDMEQTPNSRDNKRNISGGVFAKKLETPPVVGEYIKQYTRANGKEPVIVRKGSRFFVGEGRTVSFTLAGLMTAAQVLKERADRS